MKTFAKLWGIIAIGVVIAAGLSACISFKPVEFSEEEQAFKNTLDNASWEMKALDNPPSITGFEKLPNTAVELSSFNNLLARKGAEANKWYVLTAPELPGTTYYCRKELVGNAVSYVTVYKNKQ
jgi:hypothetical protein